ncbi:MAG: hypothetical protein AB1486_21800 [Planctomycetota bacterium]
MKTPILGSMYPLTAAMLALLVLASRGTAHPRQLNQEQPRPSPRLLQETLPLRLELGGISARDDNTGIAVIGLAAPGESTPRWLSGPVPLPASGHLRLDRPHDAALSAAPLRLLVYRLDPAGTPPLQLLASTSVAAPPVTSSMGLGSDPELVLGVEGATPGTLDVVRVLPDGTPGTPLPQLQGIVLLDLHLPSVVEERLFRPELPRPVRLGERAAVRLGDASTLFRYSKGATNVEGLARADRQGGVEVIWEEPILAPGEPAIDPFMAASDSGPYMAFMAGDPRHLWLYRTDGTNWPGSSSPLRDATPAGATRLEGSALVFGTDVVCAIDKEDGAFLIPLAPGAPLHVLLPPSGGLPPAVFDEEIAVSSAGHHFAFGAGESKKLKDVYVVRDDGAAANITQSPADYGEVGYSSPDRLLEITLDNDGTMVSFVNHSTPEPEGYVSSVELPDPVHITTSETFVDSIDIGTTMRWKEGGIVVAAGLGQGTLDLYYSATATDADIVNVTRTSPNSDQPPFGLGSELRLLDLGSLSGSDVMLTRVRRQAPASGAPLAASSSAAVATIGSFLRRVDALLAVDAAANRVRVVSGRYPGVGAAIPGAGIIVAAEGDALIIANPNDPSPAFRHAVNLAHGHRVQRLAIDPFSQRVALVAGPFPGALHLWIVDPSLGLATQATPSGQDLGPLVAGIIPENVHLLGPPLTGQGRELLRYTPATGVVPLGVAAVLFFQE